MNLSEAKEIVLTLDAGGTKFSFNAVRGGKELIDPIRLPAETKNLTKCLNVIVDGFQEVQDAIKIKADAISFAFPGPADYQAGIIGDLNNLTAFRGGVALGPMLKEKFGIPVFINNDADLFAYGEAIDGFLPQVNQALKDAGNPKQYKNLLGLTLGTGLGGGLINNRKIVFGDHGMGGEIWAFRNKITPTTNAEEGACIRAVKRYYKELTGVEGLEPIDIGDIALGKKEGDQSAAIRSFEQLGEVVGDVASQLCASLDCLVVIGGGISAAHELFLPATLAEMKSTYENPNGTTRRRLVQEVYNFQDEKQQKEFLKDGSKQVAVPFSDKTVTYHSTAKIGVGTSVLGTSKAVSIGAYSFALQQLRK
ncbi:MAG: ROK family protein [Cyclobacteriaceae bacterium]